MARPTAQQEFDIPIELEEPPPARLPDGSANPDHYRVRIANQSLMQVEYQRRGRLLPNADSNLKAIVKEAELAGIDAKVLVDARSEAQVYEDTVRMLLAGNLSLLEATDQQLDALDKGNENAIRYAREVYDETLEASAGRKPLTRVEIDQLADMGKALGSLIQRIRTIRERARNPIPKGICKRDGMLWEATHIIRFMLYTMRSDTQDVGEGGTDVMRIARHHAEMAFTLWTAEKGVYFHEKGFQRGVLPYRGCMWALPPRHGKSAMLMAWLGLNIDVNPDLQQLLIQHDPRTSSEMLQHVSKLFDWDEPQGRRNRALFPDRQKHEKNCNATSLRLRSRRTIRGASLTAYGVKGGRQGVNADKIAVDDPIDAKEAGSEPERKRITDQINSTWLSRLQGHKGFVLWATTLWHQDDPNCLKIRQIERKELWWTLLKRGAGGPDERFAPVWPDSPYDKHFLKRRFQEMGPDQYAVVYQCDPTSKLRALVKELALYASCTPSGEPLEMHERFLQSATRYLSVDPSATNRKGSDRAGMLYIGSGDVSWDENNDGMRSVRSVRRARVLAAIAENATQTETVHRIAGHALHNHVDHIIAEMVSGFKALGEMLLAQYGIDVIEFKPQAEGNKEKRLRDSAVMLDNSMRSKGIVPVVEWPGVWEHGRSLCDRCPEANVRIDFERQCAVCDSCEKVVDRLILDPDFADAAEQILKFGAVGRDEFVDAITQFCKIVGPDLGIGEGIASVAVKAALTGNPAKRALLDKFVRDLETGGDWAAEEARLHFESYRIVA